MGQDVPRGGSGIPELPGSGTIAEGTAPTQPGAAPAVTVVVIGSADEPASFTRDFVIGRGEGSDVMIDSPKVSRTHVRVSWERGSWQIRDLDSKNGTYIAETRVAEATLESSAVVGLGAKGPRLMLRRTDAPSDTEIDTTPAEEEAEPGQTTSFYVDHYLEGRREGEAGPRTMMIRQAYAEVSGRKRKKYLWTVGVIVALLAAAAVVALRQHQTLQRQAAVAEEMFYSMKSLELQLADLASRLAGSTDAEDQSRLESGRRELQSLRSSYDRFLEEIGFFSDDVPETTRMIYRMAGVFGECEVAMPPEAVEEIERTITVWSRDNRLAKAIRRAEENGFAAIVARTMAEVHLPPQYFYLALQESDFRTEACGPDTRYGIAKGAWQFIPSTARAYGLQTGPLVLLRRPDPADERHHFAKSSAAAARYLRDMYDRDAQASGLLVMASYNWGQSNVRRLIRSMPENPRERNFWRLLVDHRRQVPRETYNYVFRIVAAAVIGENPHQFGFEFDNPLEAAAPGDAGAEAGVS
jgi:membrane-bound lytic murein transglycosylase D